MKLPGMVLFDREAGFDSAPRPEHGFFDGTESPAESNRRGSSESSNLVSWATRVSDQRRKSEDALCAVNSLADG